MTFLGGPNNKHELPYISDINYSTIKYQLISSSVWLKGWELQNLPRKLKKKDKASFAPDFEFRNLSNERKRKELTGRKLVTFVPRASCTS